MGECGGNNASAAARPTSDAACSRSELEPALGERVVHSHEHLERAERAPACGAPAEQPVLEGHLRGGQRVDIGVHPGGIGVHGRPEVAGVGERGRESVGRPAHAELPSLAVEVERGRAEQLGQRAAARARLEVELEQPVPRGDVAQCPVRVGLAGGEDVGHRAIVVDHGDVSAKPRDPSFRERRKRRRSRQGPRAPGGLEQRTQRGQGAGAPSPDP